MARRDGDGARPRAAFIGPIIYLFFRPPEYIEDVRERELEIRAMEERLAEARPALPGLPRRGRATFLVCPVCTTRLKQACVKCTRRSRRSGRSARTARRRSSTPTLPGIDDTIADSWTAHVASAGPISNIAAVAVERTLILIKPDAIERALAGEILARIERRGFTFVGGKL